MRDVILKACIPEQKLLTVKVIKEALGLGLKETKELVDAIPSKIAERISNEKAERLREQFEKEGMKIRVKDSLTGYYISPSNTTKIIKHDNDNQTKNCTEEIAATVKLVDHSIHEETPNYWIMGTPDRGDDVYDLLHDKDSLLQSKTDVNKQMLENPSRLLWINDIHKINATSVEDNASLVNLITKNWTKLELPWKPKDKELVWAWDDDDACRRVVIFYDSKNNCTFSYEGKRYGHIFDNYAPFEGEYPEWAKEALKRLED